MILLGNEAVAHGARDAGARVVSSYPGTPSTEITETIAALGGLYAEWAANEKVAAEVAMGAAVAGARAMCCMKHVGPVSYTHLEALPLLYFIYAVYGVVQSIISQLCWGMRLDLGGYCM